MKWSARLGRFAGIDVYVHATFFLLLAWIAWTDWTATRSLAGVASGLTLVLALFLCVVLHEYGHALTARRFGIGTRSITLLPIGGLALLERMPRDPWQEIVVALAGPAVNFAIAAALFVVIAVAGRPGALFSFEVARGGLLPALVGANLMLAVFNLLPAFPLDGGRVLRAALALRMDRVRATRVAARIGQALAIGLGLLGLMGNPVLLLIAGFVWLGARSEAGLVAAEARLDPRTAGAAMVAEFHSLAPDDPLSRAVALTRSGARKNFPVLDGTEIAGILTQAGLVKGLHDLGAAAHVREAMVPAATADVGTPLPTLLEAMRASGTPLVCITRAGRLAGIVDLDEISRPLAGS